MIFRFPYLLAIFAIYSSNAIAQTRSGLRMDRYAGYQSAFLNPALLSESALVFDMQLGAGGFYFDNTYGFIRKTRLGDLRNENLEILPPVDGLEATPNNANERALWFNNNNRPKQVSFDGFGAGPGVMVRLNSGHAFGLSFQARAMGGVRKIDPIFNFESVYQFKKKTDYNTTKFRAAAAVWTETVLSYAYKSKSGNGLAFGTNVKFLSPYEGAYSLVSTQKNTFNQLGADTVRFQNANVSFGYASASIQSQSVQIKKAGNGFSIDLGVSYTYGADEDPQDYKWRLGASLIDLGSMRFTANAKAFQYKIDDITIRGTDYDYLTVDNFEDGFAQLSDSIYNDPNAALKATRFRILTPAALNVQGDFKLIKHIYVGGYWQQRIAPFFGGYVSPALAADNLLLVAPRFESRWLMFSLPVLLSEYSRPRVGLSARLGVVTVGTDYLGSFVSRNNLSGADIYFSVRFLNIGRWPGEGDSSNRRSTGNASTWRLKKRPVRCYRF